MPRFAQGDDVDITIANRLPVSVTIGWRGLDGSPDLQPLLARGPIAPGRAETFPLRLGHAGTLLCDTRLTRESMSRPLSLVPLVVTETEPSPVDRDEVILIEDWRLRGDGSAIPPGADPSGGTAVFSVNGQVAIDLIISPFARLRLRFINGSQRTVFAIQLAGFNVRVIAIDGQPSEPFLARDGRLVLAPGSRIDVLVDVTESGDISMTDGANTVKIGKISVTGAPRRMAPLPQPAALPSNGLPDKLPLQSALRVDLGLDASGWNAPAAVTAAMVPAFRVKRGRTVVLTLINPTETTAILHLHGHHMRLLDRLDDGWKPFWLDTVAVPAKQTLRVAFAATNAGQYLLETSASDWSSPTMLKTYLVET